MKYLIRSIKTFFRFVIVLALIITALIVLGLVEGDVNEIFEEGYYSLLKMAGLLALFAALYPKFAFIKKALVVEADWDSVKNSATAYLEKHGYAVETDDGQTITYRLTGKRERMSKLWEDRITLTRADEDFIMEGPGRTVMACSRAVEDEFYPLPEDKE